MGNNINTSTTQNQQSVSLEIDTPEETKISSKQKKSKRPKKTNKDKKSKKRKKNGNKQIKKKFDSHEESKHNVEETQEDFAINIPSMNAFIFKPSLFNQDSEFDEYLDEETLLQQKEEQEELFEMLKRRNSSYNKPECKICFDKIAFADIVPLEVCPHIFHKECMTTHIQQKVDSKNFPIDCPQ